MAGGSPCFCTLFGRDSLWTAQLTLPLGTDLARGTLRTLARRQGTRVNDETSEAPGKVLHEVRSPLAGSTLPPVTSAASMRRPCGSVPHDAWRWGMATDEVAQLLYLMLAWIVDHADSDGDGFLEYVDLSGKGLANQGWKDSGETRSSSGMLPGPGPDRAQRGPGLRLRSRDLRRRAARRAWSPRRRPAADVGLTLRTRFREAFWVSDDRGRFPAIALDVSKTPVAAAASNVGHLLVMGLLDADEIAMVADRMRQPDLDSGYGLRTMSSELAGFNPLGYHTGSIWPCTNTAIAIRGLARCGHGAVAASLGAGLLRAAAAFDHHLPELFGGSDARDGDPVLAYPAACRPIAWSSAAAMGLVQAAIGLDADAPGGSLRVRPRPEFAAWFPLACSAGCASPGTRWSPPSPLPTGSRWRRTRRSGSTPPADGGSRSPRRRAVAEPQWSCHLRAADRERGTERASCRISR